MSRIGTTEKTKDRGGSELDLTAAVCRGGCSTIECSIQRSSHRGYRAVIACYIHCESHLHPCDPSHRGPLSCWKLVSISVHSWLDLAFPHRVFGRPDSAMHLPKGKPSRFRSVAADCERVAFRFIACPEDLRSRVNHDLS